MRELPLRVPERCFQHRTRRRLGLSHSQVRLLRRVDFTLTNVLQGFELRGREYHHRNARLFRPQHIHRRLERHREVSSMPPSVKCSIHE